MAPKQSHETEGIPVFRLLLITQRIPIIPNKICILSKSINLDCVKKLFSEKEDGNSRQAKYLQ